MLPCPDMSLFLNCQAGISATFHFAFRVTGGTPLPLNRIANCHRPGLHLEVDLGIDVGGLDADMAKPGTNGSKIGSTVNEAAGSRV